jgi:hypothetical protein
MDLTVPSRLIALFKPMTSAKKEVTYEPEPPTNESRH